MAVKMLLTRPFTMNRLHRPVALAIALSVASNFGLAQVFEAEEEEAGTLVVPQKKPATSKRKAATKAAATTASVQPLKNLPGVGLNQHPFLYCGESDKRKAVQTLNLVRDGALAWSYDLSNEKDQLSDCWTLANGNVLFARTFGATEVNPDKQRVWNYDAPAGTEIHSVQPIGTDKVLIAQCGNPAKLIVMNKKTSQAEKEVTIPTNSPELPSHQFWHARMTATGTFLVPHRDIGKVAEYDSSGNMIWSVVAPGSWAAVRLKNGNTLISGDSRRY